jgi:hypothetical protein
MTREESLVTISEGRIECARASREFKKNRKTQAFCKESNTTQKPRDSDAFSQPEVKPEVIPNSFSQMLQLIEVVKRDIIAIEANEQNRPMLDDAFSGLQKTEKAIVKLLSQ